MTQYHLIIGDGDGNIVGQFDLGSVERRYHVVGNLPSDLNLKTERVVPDQANLGNSIEAMSENLVDWDPRLNDL